VLSCPRPQNQRRGGQIGGDTRWAIVQEDDAVGGNSAAFERQSPAQTLKRLGHLILTQVDTTAARCAHAKVASVERYKSISISRFASYCVWSGNSSHDADCNRIHLCGFTCAHSVSHGPSKLTAERALDVQQQPFIPGHVSKMLLGYEQAHGALPGALCCGDQRDGRAVAAFRRSTCRQMCSAADAYALEHDREKCAHNMLAA
jgi:hypothetical protein